VVHEAGEGLGEGFLVETEGVADQGDLGGAPQEVEAAGVEVAVDSEVHENATTCITVYSMYFASLHGLQDWTVQYGGAARLGDQSISSPAFSAMVLSHRGYGVSVTCDGTPLDEFDVKVESETTVSCYIPSQQGKVCRTPISASVGN